MFTNHNQQTAFWLIVSASLLAALIPGGPVENRDFSHIHPGILGAFNIFLTTLNIGSFVLAYFVLKNYRWALNWAFAAAIAYFVVYALDLAQLFPKSPTAMSVALASIEVLGMSAAVPLMFATRQANVSCEGVAYVPVKRWVGIAIVAALLLVGIGIVWFSTNSAMYGMNS